jgi:hypothetical protein
MLCVARTAVEAQPLSLPVQLAWYVGERLSTQVAMILVPSKIAFLCHVPTVSASTSAHKSVARPTISAALESAIASVHTVYRPRSLSNFVGLLRGSLP